MYFGSHKGFLRNFFLKKKREQRTMAEIYNFLNVIDVLKLSEDQVNSCEKI